MNRLWNGRHSASLIASKSEETLPASGCKMLSTRLLCALVLSGSTVAAAAEPKPLILSADYYPPESRRLHEEGVCVVKVTVTAEGAIEEPTLTKSSGYSRLDEACIANLQGQHMKPSMRDGRPTAVTAELPIVWRLSSPDEEPVRPNGNNLPHIGRSFYPAESLRLREEGVCVVKITVAVGGKVTVVALTHSTGFRRLDQACLAAYSDGELLPAMAKGVAIDSTTELPIAWRLGGS